MSSSACTPNPDTGAPDVSGTADIGPSSAGSVGADTVAAIAVSSESAGVFSCGPGASPDAQAWLHQAPGAQAAVRAALAAGEQAVGHTRPNPPVGAVILSREGEIISSGHTQPPGGHHAEVEALSLAGDAARGATAVVTLEPCAHTGRTGPCTQALLDAGVACVVALTTDPTDNARGGLGVLAAAGVETHLLDITATALEPWLHLQTTGRPLVTLKLAHTLDGFIAAPDGTSQWISSPEARAAVHTDRALRDAIIVGTGTALADNPRLTARDPAGAEYPTQPEPIVIGTRALPVDSHLARRGAHCFASPEDALVNCAQQGLANVLIEGGSSLAGSMLAAGLVDRIDSYVTAMVFGQGLPMFGAALTESLRGAPQFEIVDIARFGQTVRLRLRSQ